MGRKGSVIGGLKKRKNERLKDIILDHVFDYCHNEKVLRISGDGFEFTFDSRDQAKRNELLKDFIKGAKKAESEERKSEYCIVLTPPNIIQSSFKLKLKTLGIKFSEHLYARLEIALNYLVARSYLVRDFDEPAKVKLTHKGVKHYEEGRSFEDSFVSKRNSQVTKFISYGSLVIAVISLWISWTGQVKDVVNHETLINTEIPNPISDSLQSSHTLLDTMSIK